MKRCKDYDVTLTRFASFNRLSYKDSALANVAQNGKVIYTYHTNVLKYDEGTDILRLLKKGKIEL